MNVSARQLAGAGFHDTVCGICPDACRRGGVEIEITETVLMENADAALESMRRLRTTGLRFAVDDWGRGAGRARDRRGRGRPGRRPLARPLPPDEVSGFLSGSVAGRITPG